MEDEKLLIMAYMRVWDELFGSYFQWESINAKFMEVDLMNDIIIDKLTSFESQLFNKIPNPMDLNNVTASFTVCDSLNQTFGNLVSLAWGYIIRRRDLFFRTVAIKIQNGELVLVERRIQ